MWDNLRDIFECGVTTLIIVIAILALILGSASVIYYVVDSKECAAKSQAMSVKHSWGFWQGCMVESKGEIMPLKIYLEQKSKQGMEATITNK